MKGISAALCALGMFISAFVMMPSTASAAAGDTVTISGNVYAFFGIDDEPFVTLPNGLGWRARFTIMPEA